jgi:hypothetical protein
VKKGPDTFSSPLHNLLLRLGAQLTRQRLDQSLHQVRRNVGPLLTGELPQSAEYVQPRNVIALL